MIKFLEIRKIEKLKNLEKGITLVEIVVVIFIIALFSAILVSDFPKIMRQFALSRATYKMAQNIRKTEDLGLSGVQIGNNLKPKGYGVYFDTVDSQQYIIYADLDGVPRYTGTGIKCDIYNVTEDLGDCIMEIVYISAEDPGIFIQTINGDSGADLSINFAPPNPNISITNSSGADKSTADIVLSSTHDDTIGRTVSVNRSGLVEIE
jgi:type II secretory pathway pseudopilin PulG